MATITLKKNPSDKKLATIVQRIKSRNDSYAIDTGKDLLQAKAMLKHGEFGPWLKANFGWTAKTAQNYMNAASLAEKHPAVANLKPAAVAALAAPSTPDVVKSEVIADLEKGNVPTPKEIKAKIAAVKPKFAKGKSAQFSLVECLKSLGIDAAIAAMEAAFPNDILEITRISEEPTDA
ncbi:DUF3102 domain-containing protein [Shinella zoogloeoides]|uniref:DUF3102 domain-containing protein n=1 Tax=Shinella zoogloeoides TaxID=352475 RepID=UPI0028A609FC|nr:DUF3102 domain-containing protein [Shinella zoogloeoides]